MSTIPAPDSTAASAPGDTVDATISQLMSRAKKAQSVCANWTQTETDDAVAALAWSIYQPDNARKLAQMAVEDTGLGNVDDKITKNTRKTFGTLRDLSRVRTVGVIEELPQLGLVKYAKPVGVVGAVTPSTNPAATPVNKAMMALKGRNAIIIAPSPSGLATTTETVRLMREALVRIGAPEDLVQVLPAPVSKALTHALMAAVDLSVVTGSQNNVRAAYSSGKPAIGVGAGNVPVIIDADADLTQAAQNIERSKTFDNATSCSSENSVVIVDEIYDDAIKALSAAGGWLADAGQKDSLQNQLWVNGQLNRHLIARDTATIADMTGLPADAANSRFIMVEETGIGADFPFSDEKLALVLTVYRARDFEHAKQVVRDILEFKGKGHSVGIHTGNMDHARELAEQLDVVRVLVNQAHTFGNGGGFNSGLNFTLSMGCGTWQGNSLSENLNWRNFINVTHLSTVIAEDKPSEEELFGGFWQRHGR